MKQCYLFTILLLFFASTLFAFQSTAAENGVTSTKEISPGKTQSDTAAKTIYYPDKVWMVPDSNDYSNNNSPFSNQRMVESVDIAMFWAKEYGDNPMNYTEPIRRFNPATAVNELERFYICYRDTLKFVTKGSSLTDKYKMLTYVFHSTTDGTAYGGGIEDKVGALWTPAVRISKSPYGALAHELGHSFQFMVHADGAWGFTSAPKGSHGQAIFEMTSQYMLFQNYPSWMTFENYHLVSFMKQTHLAFLHEDNQYHSPYVLEYWSDKRGRDFIGKLWRGAIKGEDPVMAYKRLTGLNQTKFNDEIFDAYRKFITWDMDRIAQAAKPYANQHMSTLNSIDDGWYRIAESNCPQNYGYNGIKLNVPAAKTKVTLNFKGVAGTNGYRSINIDKAGWRYGFLAVKEDGSRVYGKVYSKADGEAKFTVPENTAYLWLVVSGAPTEHWEHLTDGKTNNDEEWPYQIKLSGTTLHSSVIK
ncbi:hypothetical protein SAMN05216464_108168 [Mucilaginibacter pineti]|uniref:DUF4859 domain-containing protein n=1 Tax=Mucilaginibacter pineti TaxID=1391627 RepID=A0A1G7EV74_9SPHI|nr:DUF6055 domain-containing protein [Mucilaginibacter pineti]SDE67386.1 hypothetical protein SAMN05216464_108168 [Mucilaginibacter pineti]